MDIDLRSPLHWARWAAGWPPTSTLPFASSMLTTLHSSHIERFVKYNIMLHKICYIAYVMFPI